MGTQCQFCKMKRVLEIDGGDVHTAVDTYHIPLPAGCH